MRYPTRPAIRTLVIPSVAAALLATMVACGGSDQNGTASGDGPTTISVWHGFTEADGRVVQEIADEFNDSQEQYRVEIEVSPWNVITDKLLSAISAGSGPDLVVQGTDSGVGYVNQGVFQSMQDFYDDPENETDVYHEHVVEATRIGAELHAVPMGYAPFSVWFNQEMFDEAGITSYPETWEEWFDLAEQLTVDDDGDGTPDVYGMSLPDTDGNFLPVWLRAGGGELLADGQAALSSPQNIETMQTWRDAYRAGWGPTNLDLVEAVDLFKAGRSAMTVIGPWIITGAEDVGLEVGTFEIPAGPDGVAAQAAANYWWLTSQAEDEAKAAAYAFLRHFNSHDSQVMWALDGNYPPNRTDIGTEELSDNEFIAEITPYTENAYIRIEGVAGGLTDINAELSALNTRLHDNTGGSVEDLAAEYDQKLDAILAQYQ